MTESADISALTDRLMQLDTRRRHLIGLTGAPGAGKSTIAARLAQLLGSLVVVVPMDGFHLASSAIAGTPRATRRGAPDTFDADGFVALLRRLRNQTEPIVYAPQFDRTTEEPIAGSIAVGADVAIVIVEGNYLLHTAPPWSAAAEVFDEIWYLDLEHDSSRVERLIARHVEFGKSAAAADEFVRTNDESNAALVAATRDRADLVIVQHDDGTLSTQELQSRSLGDGRTT